MKRETINRINNLEKHIVTDSNGKRAIFFQTVDASKRDPPFALPFNGWTYKDHRIIRLPYESAEALQARAIETVQPYLRKDQVPTFFSIQSTMGDYTNE